MGVEWPVRRPPARLCACARWRPTLSPGRDRSRQQKRELEAGSAAAALLTGAGPGAATGATVTATATAALNFNAPPPTDTAFRKQWNQRGASPADKCRFLLCVGGEALAALFSADIGCVGRWVVVAF